MDNKTPTLAEFEVEIVADLDPSEHDDLDLLDSLIPFELRGEPVTSGWRPVGGMTLLELDDERRAIENGELAHDDGERADAVEGEIGHRSDLAEEARARKGMKAEIHASLRDLRHG